MSSLENKASPKLTVYIEQAEKVFKLSAEDNASFANIADGSPQRGYSAVGVEKTASLFGHLVGHPVDDKLTDARVSPLCERLAPHPLSIFMSLLCMLSKIHVK